MIVLVITIIVIIILAVAVILTLSNNNPIENAKTAVSENDKAKYKEDATLIYADWYTKTNLGTLEAEYKDKSAEEYVKDQMRKKGYTEDILNTITVTDEGKVTISTEPVAAYPVIPKGFEYLTGTVETGYVIKNSTDGNEFVWVPVEEGTFDREFGVQKDYEVEPYTNGGTITESQEITEYNAMVASVEKYGGFYIARYEASKKTVDGVDIAQSIANQTSWNNIKSSTSMNNGDLSITTGGAIETARTVYPDSSTKTTGDAVSTLPYGVQWDATIRFILTKYPETILTDSSGYGNYSSDGINGEVIPTGSNSAYALNNIYDMAGNLFEWTMEVGDNYSRILRGGGYYLTGDMRTITSRETYDGAVMTDEIMGFRLALYIK